MTMFMNRNNRHIPLQKMQTDRVIEVISSWVNTVYLNLENIASLNDGMCNPLTL
jgi:hypothetical protein